jgi:hypothetical protein
MSEIRVELVYEKTCPNVEAARAQLRHALSEAGIAQQWREWEVGTPGVPAHVHGYGSPTILVDGEDVDGRPPAGDDYSCRVYSHAGNANKGVPALEDIVSALKRARQSAESSGGRSGWRLNGAMLPGVGAALLPKLTCPACWPAYAGLLGSLGIGFFDYTPYLLPLTAVFLLIAVGALAYRAPRRRGYGPLMVGLLAAAVLLVGKFGFDSDAAMYAGLTLLVAASLWNTWPLSAPGRKDCPACSG